jgi:drug/metabolite transporter (DMT)-like permease
LGKIFVPLLAFYFLGEQLSYSQYIGFFIIIIASVFLTFDRRRMRLNTAFWLMLVVSIVLAFQSVLIKYAYDQGVGWGTSIVWMTLFQWILATLFLLAPSNLAALNKTSTQARKIGFPFVGMVLLDWSGTLGQDFALYLLPVSIVKGIGSTQPLFALVYAILFSKKYPQVFREYIDRPHVRKKLFLFLCIIIGTLLVVW